MYKPLYKILDLNPAVINFTYQISEGQSGDNIKLSAKHYKKLLNDLEHKNGFVMAVYEFTVMNNELNQMKIISENLIGIIKREMKKDKQ